MTQSERVAGEIWNQRYPYGELRDAQDAKWYVAEEGLTERTADEVYGLLVARLAEGAA